MYVSKKQFKVKLKGLLENRLYKIYQKLHIIGRGQPPNYSKNKSKSEINKLVRDVPQIIIKERQIKKEFNKLIKHRTTIRVIGWGHKDKKKKFEVRYNKKAPYKNLVYIFFKNKKCLYVGRTINGRGRPSSHFMDVRCLGATNIKIFSTTKRSTVPELECLTIHILKPSKNENIPSKPKWSKKCPICDTQKFVKADLRKIL